MATGRPFGIVPYGTEAMGVMRIEKGHVAGMELDGRTTPDDLGLGNLVSPRKDCIGKRSLKLPALAAAGRKQLVGLTSADARTPIPRGAQLVADPNAPLPNPILGHVTATCWSPTLDQPIALALLADGRARHGTVLHAMAPLAGVTLPVVVANNVFVDPKERASVPDLSQRLSALAALCAAGAYGAPLTPSGIVLSERRGLTLIDLRGDPANAGFLRRCCNSVGLALPLAPNTSVSDARGAVLCLRSGSMAAHRRTVQRSASHSGRVPDRREPRAHRRAHQRTSRARASREGLQPRLAPARLGRAAQCAQTSIARVSVLLHALDAEGGVDLYCARSYAASLWHWLTEAAPNSAIRSFEDGRAVDLNPGNAARVRPRHRSDWSSRLGQRPFHESSLILPSLTTRFQRVISPETNLANSSGELPTGVRPSLAKRSLRAGSCRSRTVSAYSLSTTAFGVPAGAWRPNQESWVTPGNPPRPSWVFRAGAGSASRSSGQAHAISLPHKAALPGKPETSCGNARP
jgi:hypothetical protein